MADIRYLVMMIVKMKSF